jgi:hypothetical protein
MTRGSLSRRRLIGAGALSAAGCLGPAAFAGAALREERSGGRTNAREHGARGDGRADDTAAIQRALNLAGSAGGGTVSLPAGSYLLRGSLEVPAGVALEGVSRGPAAYSPGKGTVLLAVAGRGDADGAPLIVLGDGAELRAVTVFHPEQRQQNPPLAYPWAVQAGGIGCALTDVLLVNPYQGVDFASRPSGRHSIHGLYGQPLHRGLAIDRSLDVGRIENVHFWPFWDEWRSPLRSFMAEHAVAFLVGRADWEYFSNCFCIGYRIGFHFVETADGSANALLTQCGSDVGPTAVRVDQCQEHSGLSFVNGQFMASVEVGEANRGPLKLTACGLWGLETTDSHLVLAGSGHTTVTGCHFVGWARGRKDAPAIEARRGGLTVTACDFHDAAALQLRIGPEVEAALIVANRFRGAERIENLAQAHTQIGLNLATAPAARRSGAGGLLERGRLPRWRA